MKVHDEADVRAVCEAIYAQEGEAGLVRDNVQARLMARAEERGDGRVGVRNALATSVLNAYKNELLAARKRGSDASADAAGDVALPEGLSASLTDHVRTVERLVRTSHAEVLRQAEASTQARLRQMEAETAHTLSRLESALLDAQKEGLDTAGQLDDAEAALAVAHAKNEELSALAQSKADAVGKLEAESRSNRAASAAALASAFEARTRAEQQAHRSELAHVSSTNALEHTRQELARVRRESDERLAACERAEARARDAERSLDVNRGMLATLQEEHRTLRVQLERALSTRAPKAAPRARASRGSAKAR